MAATAWRPALTGAPVLLLLLVLLDIALGRATQRLATAADRTVDERQEALRNRAHRLAYWTFAGLVGGTLAIAQVASPLTRSWVAGALTSGGAGVAFGELLFVLPGMVLAWLEPDHLAPESAAPGLSGRRRVQPLETESGARGVAVRKGFRMCLANSSSCSRSAVSVCRKRCSTPASMRAWTWCWTWSTVPVR